MTFWQNPPVAIYLYFPMTRGSGGAGDGLSRNRIPLPAWDLNRPGLHPSWQGFLTEIGNWIPNQMSLTTLTSLRNIGHYHDHQFESVHNTLFPGLNVFSTLTDDDVLAGGCAISLTSLRLRAMRLRKYTGCHGRKKRGGRTPSGPSEAANTWLWQGVRLPTGGCLSRVFWGAPV
jgi:hypothetical protein